MLLTLVMLMTPAAEKMPHPTEPGWYFVWDNVTDGEPQAWEWTGAGWSTPFAETEDRKLPVDAWAGPLPVPPRPGTVAVAAADPQPEPPKEEFPARLTIRFVEPDGKEKFLPVTGWKAKFKPNQRTGELQWIFQLTPTGRPGGPMKGDLLVEENGEVGTVWVVQKVYEKKWCVVVKKEPEKKP